jgi:hypothetical protein
MSDWTNWASVLIGALSLTVAVYATVVARRAQNEAKRAKELSAIDLLANQHQIRRSHLDDWGIELDLAGIRRSVAEWRDLCGQAMQSLPGDTLRWNLVKQLAETANDFSRATDEVARRGVETSGYINVASEDEPTVRNALEHFQRRTRDLVQQLLAGKKSLAG